MANAIRERLADEGSRVLFAGRLSGSELELGRAVGEYFRTAPAAARADSPELFSLVEKAAKAGISGKVRDFYLGLGAVPEPFTDIWACGFARDILRLGPDELYVDGGAEDLFSSHRFARLTRGKYRGIIAFEPSPANYRVCLTNSALFDSRLSLRREALSSRCGGLRFTERGPDSRSDQDGELTVEVYHDGLLGDETNLWQSVRDGSVDFVVVGTPMNQEFSEMLISDWPFLYRDLEHAKAVWTGEVADEVTADFNEFFPEVEMLSWGPNSARTFSSSKPLTCVEDFAGQKFRMPNNPIHIGIVEDLGASAQVIGLGELFTALETGTVDGQDNGMVTIVDQSFQEVQSYLLETNHIIATLEIIANKTTMDSLTEEQQTIVRDAAKAAAVQAWDDYIASIAEDRAAIEEAGVTVTQLSDEERTKMIDAIQPTIDTLLEENADWAPALIEKIEAVQ